MIDLVSMSIVIIMFALFTLLIIYFGRWTLRIDDIVCELRKINNKVEEILNQQDFHNNE